VVLALAAVRRPERALAYAVLSGLAAGLALLVKPAGLGLGVVLALVLIVSFRKALRVRIVAAAVALAAISLAPYFLWSYSNERNHGVSTFSTAGDWTLYFIRGTGVLRRVTEQEPKQIEQTLADRISAATGAAPGSKTALDYQTTTDSGTLDQMREGAIDIFEDHPGWFAAMYAVGGVSLFFQPTVDGALVPAFVLAHVILYFLAFIGLAVLWRDNRATFWLITGLVAIYALGTTTLQSSGTTRLLMPLIPLIAVAAAVGLGSVSDRVRERPEVAAA
jgi:4-amino-4-deoxy-L-arabinose transferase-like glycosyltransferase